jgi:dipeptidyl aminopeptidase/acylaminoacyl peptidase
VLPLAGNDVAAVQPTASGDGRLLAYGFVSGFRSNWALRLARTEDPTDAFPLTDGDAPFYGPRWSPGHRLLACTGYLLGDPGWGVYLVDATTGNRVRVNTGPGNSRSPAWSPDGTELVFESNRSGAYKLYRVPVPSLPPAGASDVTPQAAEATPPQGDEPVLAFSFAEGTRAIVRDLSGRGNDGTIEGDAQWQDGTLRFAGKGFVTVPSPKGFDFGEGAFSIRVTLQVAEHTSSLRLIAVGDYPGNRLGWQLYLADSNQVWFNSRTPQLVFAGAVSDTVLPVGRKVTLVGIRHATGAVRLFVDGVRQASAATGAAYRYPAPNQFRLGAQFNGQHGFTGQVHEVSVYPRALTPAEIGRRSLQEFLARP